MKPFTRFSVTVLLLTLWTAFCQLASPEIKDFVMRVFTGIFVSILILNVVSYLDRRCKK